MIENSAWNVNKHLAEQILDHGIIGLLKLNIQARQETPKMSIETLDCKPWTHNIALGIGWN